MKILVTTVLATMLLILSLAPRLGAATVQRMDLDDLTAASHAIAHGRIAAARAEWDAARTLIYTVYTVEVLESLKGAPGPVLEVREPGGELDGLNMTAAGVPVFAVGEEAVLFLWTDPRGRHQVTGFEQGAVRLQTDPRTGVKTARRTIRLGSARGPSSSPGALTSSSLSLLFNQIRSSVAKTARPAVAR